MAKGSLNGGLEPTASTGQQQEEAEVEISFKVRAWLTLAILSSELILAFNITMVSRACLCSGLVSGVFFASQVDVARRSGSFGILYRSLVPFARSRSLFENTSSRYPYTCG